MDRMSDDKLLLLPIAYAHFVASSLHAQYFACFPMYICPVERFLVCGLSKQHDIIPFLKFLEKPSDAYFSLSPIVFRKLRP